MTDTIDQAKPARGRPRGSGEGRTARVEWSTTPERKERVRALAEAAGLSVAAWLDARVDSAKR